MRAWISILEERHPGVQWVDARTSKAETGLGEAGALVREGGN
jgi:hypothetical protein